MTLIAAPGSVGHLPPTGTGPLGAYVVAAGATDTVAYQTPEGVFVCVCARSLQELSVSSIIGCWAAGNEPRKVQPTCSWAVLKTQTFDVNSLSGLPQPATGKLEVRLSGGTVMASCPMRSTVSLGCANHKQA